jgi:hypothetical protein
MRCGDEVIVGYGSFRNWLVGVSGPNAARIGCAWLVVLAELRLLPFGDLQSGWWMESGQRQEL